MKEQSPYKSVKVLRETWQRLTQLSALTGEPRTKLIDRLVSEALDREVEIKKALKSKDY